MYTEYIYRVQMNLCTEYRKIAYRDNRSNHRYFLRHHAHVRLPPDNTSIVYTDLPQNILIISGGESVISPTGEYLVHCNSYKRLVRSGSSIFFTFFALCAGPTTKKHC